MDTTEIPMNPLQEYAEALPERIKQTGSDVENPVKVFLKAGNLKVIYTNGALRYISAENQEIIRMIYAALRDRNWLTIAPRILDEKIEQGENSFLITLKCHYAEGEISFNADYIIEGKADNTIVFIMEGFAIESFEKNRIGLCVLHPIEEYAGRNCVIEHNNGSTEQSVFPEEICPYQVFSDIKSMKWTADKVHCRLDFEGDVFETEDQRNWTDASFKTYSTPLSIPYPSLIEKGTRIYQKVSLTVKGSFNIPKESSDKIIVKLFPEESFRLPSIGICQASRSNPLTESEIRIIRALKFDHYRVDLHLYQNGWQFKAERGCQEASDLGYQLELALFFDDDKLQQINNFKDWYSRRRLSVASILLYHKSLPSTPDNLAREIIPVLKGKNPDVRIATGTNANFAQINRNRPGDTGNDNICYSVQPQEHASDNMTLVENLKAQEYSVRSARSFAGNKEIIISPVNIQRRFNASNSLVELPWTETDIPPQVDSRIMSLFGACWTMGSLKYLCEAGAESLTYYETVGERGIIQGEYDSRWPLQFQTVKGMIFPVYHVFRFLLSNKNLNVIRSISSRPLIADCLTLTDGKQARLLLVNFTESRQSVRLDCCSGLFRVRTLSSFSFSEAASNSRWTGIENEKTIKSQNTFEIDPYSINYIEGWRRRRFQ